MSDEVANADFTDYPIASGRPLVGSLNYDWYMSKATLERLIGVRPCEDSDAPHKPCIGIMLHYDDGSVEVIGQIAWRRKVLSDIIPVNNFMYREKQVDQRPFVKYRRHEDWDEQEEPGWISLPVSGTVIWWFGPLGDILLVR